MISEYDADGEAWRREYFPTIEDALAAMPCWVEDARVELEGAELGGISWRLEEIDEENAALNPPFYDRSGIEHARRLEDLEASYDPEELIW
jgi:hypothetical protein